MDDFKDCKILVLGDVIIDVYYQCSSTRIAQEAPILIHKCFNKDVRPGGAANVARNIRSLGGTPYLVGPHCSRTDKHQELLFFEKCNFKSFPELDIMFYKFPIKHRIWNKEQGIIFRVDEEDSYPIDSAGKDIFRNLPSTITKFIRNHNINGVIISDYDKGFVRNYHREIKEIIDYCNSHDIFMCADPIPHNAEIYQNVTAIVPNEKEYWELQDYYNFRSTYIPEVVRTRGSKGIQLELNSDRSLNYDILTAEELVKLEKTETITIGGNTINAVDVTGAGDVVAAAYTIARVAKFSPKFSAYFANLAAAKSVEIFGTTSIEIINEEFSALKLLHTNQ